eukprot:14770364-Ditylum_brightwellii.AAC.1
MDRITADRCAVYIPRNAPNKRSRKSDTDLEKSFSGWTGESSSRFSNNSLVLINPTGKSDPQYATTMSAKPSTISARSNTWDLPF